MGSRGTVLAPPGGESPVPGNPAHPHRVLCILALTATALTFLLIAIGALVRASGSGDACPDWPRCFGRWLPRIEAHVLIEYSHRFTATLDIVAVAVLAVYAWRRYRDHPRVVGPSVAALGLIVVQAALGGIVVLTKLEALNVTLHLGTAMVLAASLVLATVGAFSVDAVIARPSGSFTTLAGITAGWAFGLILVGGWVRGAGAGLAFGDWPLMGGRAVPDLSVGSQALQFSHRALALGLGILLGILLVRSWGPSGPARAVRVLATVAAGCYLGQVLVGAALVWTGLAAAPEVAHVGLASGIWGTLVAVFAASRLRSDDPVPAGALASPLERPA
jgi:heme A synthase